MSSYVLTYTLGSSVATGSCYAAAASCWTGAYSALADTVAPAASAALIIDAIIAFSSFTSYYPDGYSMTTSAFGEGCVS